MKLSVLSFGLLFALATTAYATPAEWQDLQDRCATAVLAGEKLNVDGLEDRLPDFLFDVVEDELLGPRVEPDFAGPGGRTVPTGVWGTQGGSFELWLIEYPTRAGFRAICEVREARGTVMSEGSVAMINETFAEQDAPRIEVTRPGLSAFRLTEANARGCPVVTSFSSRGGLRSTVSEAAGAPHCGGPSLASDVITPHGILPDEERGS